MSVNVVLLFLSAIVHQKHYMSHQKHSHKAIICGKNAKKNPKQQCTFLPKKVGCAPSNENLMYAINVMVILKIKTIIFLFV